MLEIMPPNIDTSGRKKYPVLFRVYVVIALPGLEANVSLVQIWRAGIPNSVGSFRA